MIVAIIAALFFLIIIITIRKNRAAHIHVNIQRRAMTEESFKMLGWVDLEIQRKAHKCILIFKCIY